MASYYVNLPAPRMPRNAMLDFSGVNSALDAYQGQQNRERQFGMQEQQLGMDRERLQLAKNADARAGEDQAWQKEQRLAQKFGALAQVIRDDPNPATAMANWQKLTQRVPQLAQKLQGYGIDPADYKAASSFLMAEAGKYKTPQQMEMERLQLAQAKQGLATGGLQQQMAKLKLDQARNPNLAYETRAAAAERFGMQPGTPQYQHFVMTGDIPAKIGPSLPAGYEPDPTKPGAMRPIAGGPADPASKTLTEGQTKDALFGERLMRSDAAINATTGYDPKTGTFKTYDPTNARRNFWPDDSYFNSNEWKQYMQAAREGLASILRKDTGAAVTQGEFDLYFPMYYPQPGDDKETVKRKAAAREQFGIGLKGASGPAWDRMYPGGPKLPTQPGGAGWSIKRLD